MLTREQFEEMLSKRNSNNAKANNQPKVGEQVKMPGVPDYSNVGRNKPTQKMVDAIYRLAERKQVEVDTANLATFEDARVYMQELYDLPNPAMKKRPLSQKQIDKIKQLCNETQTPEPNYDELDGGYGASGSLFIQELIKKSQDEKNNIHIPLTANQSAEIHRYQLCPDVTAHNADGKPFSDEDIEKMSKAEAYQYIGEHRNEYYAWIKSRLSDAQIARIEQLHDMMGCPRMGYEALIQFDTEQASLYITQLEAEYNRKDWNVTSLEKEDNYLNDEVRHRHDQTEEKALKDMRAMAAKLYAAMGQQLEDDVEEFDLDDYKELVLFTAETAGEEVARNIVEDNESLSPELKDWFFEDDAPFDEDEDTVIAF